MKTIEQIISSLKSDIDKTSGWKNDEFIQLTPNDAKKICDYYSYCEKLPKPKSEKPKYAVSDVIEHENGYIEVAPR